MKKKFIEKTFVYSGQQLRPLFAYLEYGLLGNSIVSWIGPCDVKFDKMKDGEDLREKAKIKGDKMLHFIVEVFDRDLFSAVSLQRLFAAILKDLIEEKTEVKLRREGDDLYLKNKKLSISIAAPSSVSNMIHFAVNITNKGTPVETLSLEDLKLKPKEISNEMMKRFAREFESILSATQKVLPCV